MPSNLGAASSWDPQSACEYGEVIGRELRAQGFDMTLGGGVNVTREPETGAHSNTRAKIPSGRRDGRKHDEV